MSVPLDRLYNHLDGLCNHDILIYRFYPHGSKKLTDLSSLYDFKPSGWKSFIDKPGAICHDQEPLFFDQYNKNDILNCFIHRSPMIADDHELTGRVKTLINEQHLRAITSSRLSVYDKTLLIHSEKNSTNLSQFETVGFVGVYWWVHAAIAADWYRYAEYDVNLIPNFNLIKKDFLVYNRAWSGTRAYRLTFIENLVKLQLQNNCLTTFNPVCESGHYRDFVPANHNLKIEQFDIEGHIGPCLVDGTASADYNNHDYQTTAIEVVLETLFDDTRWHLTEKSLRPIACGRPFILASTAGSLQYLRSYGFKTFNGLIDENYDLIQDPVERLHSICKEMKRISQLPTEQKHQLWEKLYKIANYNKNLFFSRAWQQSVFDEFINNLDVAMDFMNQHKNGVHWCKFRDAWNLSPEKFNLVESSLLESMKHQEEVEQLIKQ